MVSRLDIIYVVLSGAIGVGAITYSNKRLAEEIKLSAATLIDNNQKAMLNVLYDIQKTSATNLATKCSTPKK